MKRRAQLRRCGVLSAFMMTLAVLSGCAQRPFAILDRRVCSSVDTAGKPGPEATKLTPQDKVVYVWFRYTGAKPGQAVKVKFKYTDRTGVKASEEVRTELKPGLDVAAAQLKPPGGEGLTPGKYEAEITNDSDVAYGPALTFEVQGGEEAPGTAAVGPGTPAVSPGLPAGGPGTPAAAPGRPAISPGAPGGGPGKSAGGPGTPAASPRTPAGGPAAPAAAPRAPAPRRHPPAGGPGTPTP